MSKSRTTTPDTRHQDAFSGFGPDDLMVRLPLHRPPTHPGELLREEYLRDYGWSAGDLARRLHVPQAVVDGLLAEETPLTPDLALRLGRLFNQTPAFWIKCQLAYDFWFALQASAADLARIEPVPDADSEPLRKVG